MGVASLPIAGDPAGAQQPAGSGLGNHDKQLLTKARRAGSDTVTLLIASSTGKQASVVSGVEALGGEVVHREDDIGYIRVVVPTGQAEAAAKVSGVEAADLDEIIPLDDPRPRGAQDPVPFPAPSGSTPRSNPYMPIRDTGAAAFLDAHPKWDGRGVRVGVLDSGITLDHPALRTTTTGKPKIVDWVTYTHPTTDNDPTWVPVTTQVRGRTFVVGGNAYTAPSNGRFRFGTFNERDPRLGGEVGSDVNRDGNPAGSNGTFAVLWDGGARVWVDVDQDFSFADEPYMRDYKVRRDFRYFGTDNPATPVAERMPFVIQVDRKAEAVNIGIVSGQHGSHVAGIIAANGLFNRRTSGAAPGAELVSVRVCLFITGCTNHALLEGMIYAAKNADVDVINMSIGGLPSLNDANNARAVLYDRLIAKYDVQMFISAGNSGPGENTVGDPSVATSVMSVGTSITDATWQSNYGSLTDYDTTTDNQHPFSSRGPREDGGFKPQIIAPGAAISTTPLWQPGGPVAGVHTLPPGLSMLNGTSMASPQAAGAAALLVSAAQQRGVSHTPEQLRKAMNSSARYIPGSQAHEQGNGLIRVGAAWALLAANNLKDVSISSKVPVNTALSFLLATPGIGVGIHDREGVVQGEQYSRTYTFTRTSGRNGPVTYNLSLVGNDGTFSLASTGITLPKNTPVTFDVTVNPNTPGVHSAILNLNDPSTPGIEYQTMNTVVVPLAFDEAGDFQQNITAEVGRNKYLTYFFEVPPGTPAFKVDFSGPSATPGTGQARFLRFHPFGVGIDPNSSLNCYVPDSGGGCPTGSPNSRTQVNPQAGVWEVTVEARRTSDVAETPFSLTASVLGATVSPNPDIIPSATVGVPVDRSYTITNVFGSFTGRAVGTTMGSAFRARPTIAQDEVQDRTVTVSPGSASLRATIGNTAASDLDLFVFRCPTPTTCALVGSSADGDSEESVTISNPPAGEYLIRVEGFTVAAPSEYDYIDVFVNSSFGTVAVTDANASRPAGASWTVPGTVTALAAPSAGRVLFGRVEVRTDENVLVGGGDVIVQTVT